MIKSAALAADLITASRLGGRETVLAATWVTAAPKSTKTLANIVNLKPSSTRIKEVGIASSFASKRFYTAAPRKDSKGVYTQNLRKLIMYVFLKKD